MRVEDALSQLRTIQIQLARTERYCCYQSATVAMSGALALAAALVQASMSWGQGDQALAPWTMALPGGRPCNFFTP